MDCVTAITAMDKVSRGYFILYDTCEFIHSQGRLRWQWLWHQDHTWNCLCFFFGIDKMTSFLSERCKFSFWVILLPFMTPKRYDNYIRFSSDKVFLKEVKMCPSSAIIALIIWKWSFLYSQCTKARLTGNNLDTINKIQFRYHCQVKVRDLLACKIHISDCESDDVNIWCLHMCVKHFDFGKSKVWLLFYSSDMKYKI